jgi:hypothetical protein
MMWASDYWRIEFLDIISHLSYIGVGLLALTHRWRKFVTGHTPTEQFLKGKQGQLTPALNPVATTPPVP